MDLRKYIKRSIFLIWLILLIPGLVFGGSQQTSSTLASTIITNARMYLNDTVATYFHNDGEMLVYLNNGTMDIVSRTHCLERIENIILQADTINYPISNPFIVIKNVLFDSRDNNVTNGIMEADSSWSDFGTPTINLQKDTYAYHGTYSWHIRGDPDEGMQSEVFTTVTGTTYYYSLFVYPEDETAVNVYIYKGDNSGAIVDVDYTGLTKQGWNAISGSYTETAGGAGAYIALRNPTGGAAASDIYVDNVSVYTQGFLKPLLKGSLEHMIHVDPELGEPSYWAQWGNDVYTYPRPNSDCAGKILEVCKILRPIAVGAAENVLVPAYYDRALTLYIVAQALKKDEKYAKSNAVLAEYQAELDRFKQDFSYQSESKVIE